MAKLPQDFSDFLRLLNDRKVRFMVVGGYAVAHHGFVRYTGDIDVWIAIDPANAAKMMECMLEFGFDSSQAQIELFLEPGNIIRMGVEPTRIEILTGISGVEFDQCFDRRVEVDFSGVCVPFIGLGDLRANKCAAGRDKDLLDLNNLPKE